MVYRYRYIRIAHFDIIEPFLTNQESPSQSSEISALNNRMNESFILSSPILRMEGIENTGFQQAKSYLRCVKCSEDLSSCLPPVSFLRFPPQPQGPPQPLVYLTCKPPSFLVKSSTGESEFRAGWELDNFFSFFAFSLFDHYFSLKVF